MQRTVSLKLVVTAEQAAALEALAREFAAGCNIAARLAAEHRCTNRVRLHHLAYYAIRAQTNLGSQMTCNAVRAAASAYRTMKSNRRLPKDGAFPAIVFGDRGAVHFDKRTYSIRDDSLSLYTTAGRIRVSVRYGEHQARLLAVGEPKEAKLVQRRKGWFFNLVLDMPAVAPLNSTRVLGVDLGENNLAATSSGKILGGGKLRYDRDRYLALRARLQRNGSQSARQLLKKVSGRERRRVTHVNHEVSKAIVAEALREGCGVIAMERLTHIRERIKAGKRVRSRLHRWAWAQLQAMIAYKAEAAGIQVVYVDPAYSSQACSVCGCLALRRKHLLSCSCGHRAHADVNAASNLARLGEAIASSSGDVNRRNVAAIG